MDNQLLISRQSIADEPTISNCCRLTNGQSPKIAARLQTSIAKKLMKENTCEIKLLTSCQQMIDMKYRAIFCRLICLFVALRPKSTAMVMVGRSVHLTTLFPGKLKQVVNQCTYFRL